MYGTAQYGTQQYGSEAVDKAPFYNYLLETFVLSELQAKASVTKTISEVFAMSENTNPSRTKTTLEELSVNDVSVRPILNGQTAVWIRIPKNSTIWNSLPKN